MCFPKSSFVTAAVAAAVLCVASAPVQAQVTFTLLPSLPGVPLSAANAVSADGSVVVGSCYTASGGYQAVRWENGTATGLGILTGDTTSYAYGISSDGVRVVGNSYAAPVGSQAFQWENGTMVGLGFLPGHSDSSAYGISSDGTVVVGASSSATGTQAVRWNNGVITALGLLSGGSFSYAVSVSNNLQVTIGYGNSPAGTQAIRWQGQTKIGLGFLPGGNYSYANAVSGDGAVVVGYSGSTPGPQAFRWENGTMTGLGFLPYHSESNAYGISQAGGLVVGQSYSDSEGARAFLWRADLGMVNLKLFAIDHGATGLDGWVLDSASAISADGTTIVGRAYRTGSGYRAFVLRAVGPEGFLDFTVESPLVSGRVALEGLNAASARCPVEFAFRPSNGGEAITFTQDLGGAPDQQEFTFRVPAGQYELAVKGATHLRQTLPVEVGASGYVTLPPLTLLTGDVSGDNRVNLTDLVRLRANFGKTGANLAGDLNRDNRVNLSDLVLLRANYGQTGLP